MNQKNLLRNIEQLKSYADKFRDITFKEFVGGLEKDYRTAIIDQELCDHPIIKGLVERFSGMVNGITYQLQTESSEKLPDTKRDRLLDQRELYLGIINLFLSNEKQIESIGQKVEETRIANNL